MDFLRNLLKGNPNLGVTEEVEALSNSIPVSGDRQFMPESVPVGKSDLLGNILQGIPGVSGFPITHEAEQNLAKQRAAVQQEPIVLPEMTIKAPTTKRKTIQPKADVPETKETEIPASRSKPVELMPFGEPDQEAGAIEPVSAAPQEAPKTIEAEVDQELLDAQKQRRDMMLLQMLTRAGHTIGSAIAGTKADPNYLKEFDPLIQEPMEALKERRASKKEKDAAARQAKLDIRDDEKFAMDKEITQMNIEKIKSSLKNEQERLDPNSVASQAARQFQEQRFKTLSEISKGALKYTPGMFEGMNVEQLENSFGKFSPENIATSVMSNERLKEDSANRRQAAKDAAEAKKLEAQAKKEEKNRRDLDSYIQKQQKDTVKMVEKVQKGRTELAALESALAKPSAVKDIGALYSMVKGFDPESAVREGELVLAAKGQSYADNIKNLFSRLKANDTRVLQPGFLKQIADYTREVQKVREDQYHQIVDKRLQYASDRLGMQPEEREFIDPLLNEQPVSRIAPSGYTPEQEMGIDAVLAKNPGATRQQVIDALKAQGKLK